MKIIRILLASVTGTACMSLFSYFVSKRSNRSYEAPVMLSALLSNTRALRKVKKKRTYQLGWLLHYLTGLSFSVVYDRIWSKTGARPSLQEGILFGSINGVVGVLIWKAAIDSNPAPPQMEYKDYYSHLLAAHIVFGAFTTLGYMVPSVFREKGRPVLEVRESSVKIAEAKAETAGKNFHSRPHDVHLSHQNQKKFPHIV